VHRSRLRMDLFHTLGPAIGAVFLQGLQVMQKLIVINALSELYRSIG
jgi:hypothetical protein